ncbi:MAG: DUF285 domain-containing protein [Eubacterium sp.]|nr:DUF285 domain-containing protein [Eubacterium sp.]
MISRDTLRVGGIVSKVLGKNLRKEPGIYVQDKDLNTNLNMDKGNRINYKNKSFTKGFTLVELIVVLVIIAIITAVTTPLLLGVIEDSKDKERMANGDAAIKSAQVVLTDLYNNCSNTLTPELRSKIRENAGSKDGDNTGFWIWNAANLEDGITAAIAENLPSYTVSKALYKEDGIYYYYDGKEWTKTSYEDDDSAIVAAKAKSSSDMLTIWPGFTSSSTDIAYDGTNTQGGDDTVYQEGVASVESKTVTLISDQPQSDERFVTFTPVTQGKQTLYQVSMTFKISGGTIKSSNWDYDTGVITNKDSEDGDQYTMSLNEDFDFTGWKLTSIDGSDTDENAVFGNDASGDSGLAMGIESLKSYIFNTEGDSFTFQATVDEQVISKNVTFNSCENDLIPFGEDGSCDVTFNKTKHFGLISEEGWDEIETALSESDIYPWSYRGWLTTSNSYTSGDDGLYNLAISGSGYGLSDIEDMVFNSEEESFDFTLAAMQEKKAILTNDTANKVKIDFLDGKTEEEYSTDGGSVTTTVTYNQYMPENILIDDWDSQIGNDAEKKVSAIIPQSDDANLLTSDSEDVELKIRAASPAKDVIKNLLFEGKFSATISLKGGQKIDCPEDEDGNIQTGTVTAEGDTSLDVSKVKSMKFVAQGGKSHTMFYANFGVYYQSDITDNKNIKRFERWPVSEGQPTNLSSWTDITISETDWAYSNGGSYILKDSTKKAYYKSLIDDFSEIKVYGHLEDNGTYYWYTTADEVYLNPCCAQMFCECTNITYIDLSDLDASYVTNEKYEKDFNRIPNKNDVGVSIEHNGLFRFFYNCKSLTTIVGLDDLFASGAASHNYAEMFKNCEKLTTPINAANLAYGQLEGQCAAEADIVLNGMFEGCKALTDVNINVSGTTEKGIYLYYMFNGCTSLKNVSYSTDSVLKYKSLSYMFNNAGSSDAELTIDFGTMDIESFFSDGFAYAFYNSKVKSLTMTLINSGTGKIPVNSSSMFNGARILSKLNVTGFDKLSYLNPESMFQNAGADGSGFDVNFGEMDITNIAADGFKNMFNGSKVQKVNMNITNNSGSAKAINCNSMFQNCKLMSSLELKGFEQIQITNASYMFYLCWDLTEYDFLTQFDTSECTNMKCMFEHAGFNCASPGITLDMRTFDTSKVTSFENMFSQWNSANGSRSGMLYKMIVSDKFVVNSGVTTKNMYDWCQNIQGENGTTYQTIYNKYGKNTADGKDSGVKAFRQDGGPNSDTPGYLWLVDYVEPYSPQE